MFLSLPESWHYSVRGLAAISKEGVEGIQATLRELERAGYLVRHQSRDESGHLSKIEYEIFETPQMRQFYQPIVQIPQSPHTGSPCTEKPYTVNPYTGKPYTETPAGINTEVISKERINTESNNNGGIKSGQHNSTENVPSLYSFGRFQNVFLSGAEYASLKMEFPNDYQQRIEQLSEYMVVHGKVYKNTMGVLRGWMLRNKGSPIEDADPYTREGNNSL